MEAPNKSVLIRVAKANMQSDYIAICGGKTDTIPQDLKVETEDNEHWTGSFTFQGKVYEYSGTYGGSFERVNDNAKELQAQAEKVKAEQHSQKQPSTEETKGEDDKETLIKTFQNKIREDKPGATFNLTPSYSSTQVVQTFSIKTEKDKTYKAKADYKIENGKITFSNIIYEDVTPQMQEISKEDKQYELENQEEIFALIKKTIEEKDKKYAGHTAIQKKLNVQDSTFEYKFTIKNDAGETETYLAGGKYVYTKTALGGTLKQIYLQYIQKVDNENVESAGGTGSSTPITPDEGTTTTVEKKPDGSTVTTTTQQTVSPAVAEAQAKAAAVKIPDPFRKLSESTGKDLGKYRSYINYNGRKRYYSSTDAVIFLNNTRLEEIVAMNWAFQEMKMPIWGYNSYTWDEVAIGTRQIQGTFVINYIIPDYLLSVGTDGASDDDNSSIYNSSRDITPDNMKPYQGWPQKFSIMAHYGDLKEKGSATRSIFLEDVYIQGCSQMLAEDGSPIYEQYQFIARDMKFLKR